MVGCPTLRTERDGVAGRPKPTHICYRGVAVRTFLLALLLTIAPLAHARAQYFGQNRVNYRSFDFNIIATEHFDVYYYDDLRAVAVDAAMMAERAYGRLSRLLNHQYRERQPIILYGSHAEFQQNDLTDIGEGVQGVTDPYRHRVILPFTGSYADFEQVLEHEIVHQFQFDIFARGYVGAGIERLIAVQPPLWLTEGLAEYLSIGTKHTGTDMWIRDAVRTGTLPTIDQMTSDSRIFPYRYGHALMSYIAQRWGDDVIADIFHGVASGGLESGFRRALGIDLQTLSRSWHDDVRNQLLPDTLVRDDLGTLAQSTVNRDRSGGGLHVSPSLSPSGTQVIYFSEADEYSVNMYLADVASGTAEKRLVKSAFSANFESVRFLNSGVDWSRDGERIAFPAQHSGRDDLVLFDVRRRKTIRRIRPALAGITSPSWSPDGTQLVFSGLRHGVSDLYVVNDDGTGLQQLTADRHADLHPTWSPDGRYIAFATDRGPQNNFADLRPGALTVALFDLETRTVRLLPVGGGSAVNPQWSPDGTAVAFVSDRNGVANVFVYDIDAEALLQITDVYTGVSGITPTSPAISWARDADRLALTYYERGEYNIYTIDNPRDHGREVHPQELVAEQRGPDLPGGLRNDSLVDLASPGGSNAFRSLGSVPRGTAARTRGRISVKDLLDSAALVLPDTSDFAFSRYSPRLLVDYFSQPQLGYTRDNFGSGVYGGAAVALSDIMGSRRLLLGAQVNGHLAESQVAAVYANMAHRTNWAVGIQQTPYFFYTGANLEVDTDGQPVLNERLQRFVARRAFVEASRPFSRFSRLEYRFSAVNMGIGDLNFRTTFDRSGSYVVDRDINRSSFGSESYVQPALAWVFDNTIHHVMGPLRGRRSRLEYAPAIGSWQFHQTLLDSRRYDALPGPFTLATRALFFGRFGADSDAFPIFLGVPDLLRGYTSGSFRRRECSTEDGTRTASCDELNELVGSRVAVFNAELRFPLLRYSGGRPFPTPPVEGAVFFDTGVAWRDGTLLSLTRSDENDKHTVREPLSSWGVSIRSNVFGFVILRLDYTKPLSRSGHPPYLTLSLGPTF